MGGVGIGGSIDSAQRTLIRNVDSQWTPENIKIREYKVAKPAPEPVSVPEPQKPEIRWHNAHKLIVTHSPVTSYRCEHCGIEGRIYLTPFTDQCKGVDYGDWRGW